MRYLLVCLALLMAWPALADAQCITAKEYLTMTRDDFHRPGALSIGDWPGAVEVEEWRLDFEESVLLIDLFELPFAAERFSFYAAPAGETVVVAAFWSGCLVAAIEISRVEAVEIIEMVKGPPA